MSYDPNILFSQSVRTMDAYLRNRPTSETIGSAMLIIVLIGGMLEDSFLFVLGAILTAIVYLVGLISSIQQKLPLDQYSSKALRRMLILLWAYAMYDIGEVKLDENDVEVLVGGAEIISLPFAEIDVALIFGIMLAGFTFFWFLSRFFDQLDMENLLEVRSFYIILRGIFRGAILAALLYSVFINNEDDGTLTDPFALALMIAYLADPFVAYIQSEFDKTLDPTSLSLGLSKLPMVALRDTIISNTFILIFTMWFGGLNTTNASYVGPYWSLIRGLYVIAAVVIIMVSMENIKKFNSNPLAQSIIGSSLANATKSVNDLNLKDQMGYITNNNALIDMGKDKQLSIYKDSILVPLGENKGKVEAMLIGKGESISKAREKLSSQVVDGVSTLVISKKEFNKLTKNIIPNRMDMIRLEHLNLPSLDTIQNVVSQLGFNMSGWMDQLQRGLSNINLSNYGVSEIDGVTRVNLPGISVIEGGKTTKVDVFGIKVLDSPQMTNVKIGNFLTVVEMPKVQLVSLPFMTVLELEGHGTAIDIMGFKIGDGIDASRLQEFKAAFLAQMERYNELQEHELGKILVDDKANALMSISWDGEFTPLLQGKKDSYNDFPALGSGEKQQDNLLPGKVDNMPSMIDPKFAELTGYGTKKGRKKKGIVKMDLDIAGTKVKINVDEDTSNDEKLDDVQQEINSIKDELKGKKKEDDYEIIDVDYEIVDDEE